MIRYSSDFNRPQDMDEDQDRRQQFIRQPAPVMPDAAPPGRPEDRGFAAEFARQPSTDRQDYARQAPTDRMSTDRMPMLGRQPMMVGGAEADMRFDSPRPPMPTPQDIAQIRANAPMLNDRLRRRRMLSAGGGATKMVKRLPPRDPGEEDPRMMYDRGAGMIDR